MVGAPALIRVCGQRAIRSRRPCSSGELGERFGRIYGRSPSQASVYAGPGTERASGALVDPIATPRPFSCNALVALSRQRHQSRYLIWSVQKRSRRSQRHVHAGEVVAMTPPICSTVRRVLLVEAGDDAMHLLALLGQADADRAAVDARAGVMEIAHLDQLLDVVGDVRAEVVAARAQFAGGQLLVADVDKAAAPAPR